MLCRTHSCPFDGGQVEQVNPTEFKCVYCHTNFSEKELVFYKGTSDVQMLAEIDQIRNLRQEGDFYKVEGRIKIGINVFS